MALSLTDIDVGSAPGDGTGDPARTAFQAVNSNNALIESAVIQSLVVAVSDETTVLTTGTAKVTFRMPYAFTLSEVRATVTTATGAPSPEALLTIDINENPMASPEVVASILSTKLTIDAGERTSVTATTAAVISDTSLADDTEMTVDIDVADGASTGLKIYLIGTRT